jgi:hypothetical protein
LNRVHLISLALQAFCKDQIIVIVAYTDLLATDAQMDSSTVVSALLAVAAVNFDVMQLGKSIPPILHLSHVTALNVLRLY